MRAWVDVDVIGAGVTAAAVCGCSLKGEGDREIDDG